MAKPSTDHLIARYLEHCLRCTPPGGALPSVRQLMEQCKVGPQTVTRVVRHYEKLKLVDARPKSGLFRPTSEKAVPKVKRLDVIYLNVSHELHEMLIGNELLDNSFHGELIAAIKQVATQRGYELFFHAQLDADHEEQMIEALCDEPDCRACLTVGLSDMSMLRDLTHAYLSVINLYPMGFHIPTNAICTHADQVIDEQLSFLIELGHRRIAYLHNVEDHRPHRDLLLRREAFYRQAMESGVELHRGYVRFAGFYEASQIDAARQLLAINPRPTAVICADQHLPALYQAASELQLQIGKDLSVLGTDNKLIAQTISPPATSLQVPRVQAVHLALDMLDEVLVGHERSAEEHLQATCRVICRQSTGPVKHS
jgi:DNA-binding LacI/PurR family transcriptional regulator